MEVLYITAFSNSYRPVCVLSHFSRVWLFVDHNTPGCSIHGIFLERILEWVVMPSSLNSIYFTNYKWITVMIMVISINFIGLMSELLFWRAYLLTQLIISIQNIFPKSNFSVVYKHKSIISSVLNVILICFPCDFQSIHITEKTTPHFSIPLAQSPSFRASV